MSTDYHDLSAGAFEEDWSDPSAISASDNWSGVPSIVGYLGDYSSSSPTDADPRTLTAASTLGTVDVTINQTNPNSASLAGGVLEFDLANDTIALNGSGTADAPSLVLFMNAAGRENVTISFDVRDLDSVDNVAQQLNVQYRTSPTGAWTNLPNGYFADVTAAGASQVTNVSLTLPAAADDQATLQIRIMTVNAGGADETIGIDNIVVDSEPQGGGEDPTEVTVGDVSIVEGDAGTKFAEFTVTRSDNAGAFSVEVDTADGTAAAGQDYAAVADQIVSFTEGGALTQTVQVQINGDTTVEANETFTVSLSNLTNTTGVAVISDGSAVGTITNDDVSVVRIFDIQGAAGRSPLAGQTVTTRGIVTAIDASGTENGSNNPRGFYIQDATGDGDYSTSDAVFVFLGTGAGAIPSDIQIGSEIQFTATVSEFLSGQQLPVTQLNPTSGYTVLSTDNDLPEAVRIGDVNDLTTGLQRRPELVDLGDDDADLTPEESGSTYDPVNQGADFWESLEGMRVVLEDVRITSPFRSAFDEQFATPNVGANPSANDRGGLTIRETTGAELPENRVFDFNPERIQLDDEAGFGLPTGLEVGDRLGDVVGVVNYANNQWEVNATQAYATVTKAELERETTDIVENLDRIRVASFNVENLAPVGALVDGQPTTQAKFDALADAIIDNLQAPEIIGLQEVLDNDGAANTSVVSASETLSQLIETIVARGGPRYVAVDSWPEDDAVGGIPGGNQRVAYLFNPEAVTPTAENGLTVVVTDSEGDPSVYRAPASRRIGEGNDAFEGTRKSLAIEWSPAGYSEAQGGAFTTINNHFSSKGGSAPLYGQNLDLPLYTDPLNGSAQPTTANPTQREGQAEAVNAYVDGLLSDGDASNDKVVALGDFNDFQFFPVVGLVTGALVRTSVGQDGAPSRFAVDQAVLAELIAKLPEAERYSYNFDGNAQALDHILVSTGLYDTALFDIVHINSEFAEQVSDHDPSVAALRFLRSDAIATEGGDKINQAAFDAAFTGAQASRADLTGDDVIDGKGGDDVIIAYDGADTLIGGAGNDRLAGGLGDDLLNGGGGSDTARYGGAAGGVKVSLGTTLAQDTGAAGRDVLVGIENLTGSKFADELEGDEGVNALAGGEGDDQLGGRAGDDALDGGSGKDELLGGGDDDRLTGGDGDDVLEGDTGNDALSGGAGLDTLKSGTGADRLDGGLGADAFSFGSVFDSVTGERDRIAAFSFADGDRIDLSAIDADETGPVGVNELFTFVDRFTGQAGQLTVREQKGDKVLVLADTDGDGIANFVLQVFTAEAMTESAFVL